jgi:hypothetical protein
MRIRILLAGALVIALLPGRAVAQTAPLSGLLADLLLRSVTMTSTAGIAGNPHEAHFIAAETQFRAPFEINKALVGQLGTFPNGSSSGGFVFNFDTATGLFKPASQSFGPGFAERALTNGQGRVGFGLNFQRLEFSSFEGVDLQNGDFAFVLQHNDCCAVAGNPLPDPEDPFFEGDLVKMAMSLKVKTDVFAPFVSYGLTNRWDLGVVVPVVRVELSPSITSTIDRIATGTNVAIHSWNGLGQTTKVESLSGTSSGLGDIVLRTKYRFVDAPSGGVAAAVDVRLPTGDKENLLGTGAVQTKLQLIASTEFSRVEPHVNVGYTISRGELSSALTTFTAPSSVNSSTANPATLNQINSANGTSLASTLKLPNEVNYTVGLDVAAHSLVTLSADLIGRTMLDSQRFGLTSQAFQYRTANSGALLTTSRDTLNTTGTGNLNLLLGVVGAKVNLPRTPLLLTASLLFPLTDAGLKPKVTPVVGLDYSFKR